MSMRIWTDETDRIVVDMWGEGLRRIANAINNYNVKVANEKGHRGTLWCGLGSVAFRAESLGIIDESERRRILYQARKREKIPSDVRCKIIRRDRHRCLACGSKENLQIDHIEPVRLGGGNEWDNLQTLCRRCNARKGIGNTDYRRQKRARRPLKPKPMRKAGKR